MDEPNINAIELFDIKKNYGNREVLNIDAFNFERGRKYALLGANGSGKSTLLRILAGMIPLDQGNIRFINPYEPKDIAYLPQKPYAFAMPVEKSIMLGADRHNRDKRIAMEVLERVGMIPFLKEREDKLSGGEAQRVALARTMLQKRKLLLLDEPFSATDIAGAQRIEKSLLEFCAVSNCTLIFATHSPAQALRMADFAVFMDAGTIMEYGNVNTVIHTPASQSAKAFLKTWRF